MKYAIVDGLREEARPDLQGECPGCGRPTLARCGEVRVRHWAHRGRAQCDPWWENETAWHRAWKDVFPAAWQEIVHPAENGERHIADVKTPDGWVMEFQHSYLEQAERRSRDAFYPKLLWVVDGTRRKRDQQQFKRALDEGHWFGTGQRIRQVWTGECGLLREWAESAKPVFFDFDEQEQLWWVLSQRDTWAYVAPFPRMAFVAAHRITGGEGLLAFDRFVTDWPLLIANHQRQRMVQSPALGSHQTTRIRRRFRF
jgi:hypothetical protein